MGSETETEVSSIVSTSNATPTHEVEIESVRLSGVVSSNILMRIKFLENLILISATLLQKVVKEIWNQMLKCFQILKS